MDIEALAAESGLDWMLGPGATPYHETSLRAFAAAVCAAERAACIRACESQYQHDPESDFDSGVAACARPKAPGERRAAAWAARRAPPLNPPTPSRRSSCPAASL